jgi:hypothetical protein
MAQRNQAVSTEDAYASLNGGSGLAIDRAQASRRVTFLDELQFAATPSRAGGAFGKRKAPTPEGRREGFG